MSSNCSRNPKSKKNINPLVLLSAILLIMGLNFYEVSAQCTVGSNSITWAGAASGSQTSIPVSTTAGGPPSPITDQIVGCTTSGSVNSFDFTTTITETNGTVYDRMRSGTNGIYGTGYFSITIDNVDGGTGTSNYSAGNAIDVKFDFQYPVVLNNLVLTDLDYDTGTPFQDRVIISAKDILGNNVPVTLTTFAGTVITVSGQTATATTNTSGINPGDPAGNLRLTTSLPIASLTIQYIAGPSVAAPRQQAIGITTFDVCCPTSLVKITGNVFKDCDGLTNSIVDGTLLSLPSGVNLYVNVYDVSTNKIVGNCSSFI